MSRIKPASARTAMEWKDIARLFCDFESGEVLPPLVESGITEVAIQVDICARLFQNGFEEDANAVWQRMISNDLHVEQREHLPLQHNLSHEGNSTTTPQNEEVQYRTQSTVGEAMGSSGQTKTTSREEKKVTERAKFDFYGTPQSDEPKMASKKDDMNTHP